MKQQQYVDTPQGAMCNTCGALVSGWAEGRERHDLFHEGLGEVIEAVRVLSALGPSITPLSMLGGPTRTDYEALSAMARRASIRQSADEACPSCHHKAHGVIRCRVADGGDNDQPNLCECVYVPF